MIESFYAVTLGPSSVSVYFVRKGIPESGESYATAEKIALRGESKVGIGSKLTSAMIAICKQLISYIPEGGGITTFQRKIELVNTRYWNGSSSPLVALFFDRDSAMRCFEAENIIACDPRWTEETKKVIETIGDEHPRFEVCRWPNLALFPEPEAAKTK